MAVVINGNNGISYDDTGIQYYGTGNDLAIRFDGTDAIINEAGSGDLKLQSGGTTKLTIGSGVSLNADLSTNGNDINFGDNDKAQFGASNDLQIYHDGSNSFIVDGGTGNLYLQADNYLTVRKNDGSKTAAAFNTDGEVTLKYDNASKLATTSTGIDVTGTVTADQYDNDEALPTIRPSLLLDFANSKTLDPRITFTRASTATYYDGKTHTKAEENLQVYSEEFDNSAWFKSNITVTANNTTAPDGTTTADLLTISSTAVTAFYDYFSGGVAGETICSVYAKAGTKDVLQFSCNVANWGFDKRANFDLTNGVLGTVDSNMNAEITNVGNGWYRCSVRPDGTKAEGQNLWIIVDSTTSNREAPTTAGTMYVWGAQVETRDSSVTTPTAYTPTTSQPITNYIPKLMTAASGVARFDHDSITKESKGLLIEEQRTNYYPSSTDWSSNITVGNNSYTETAVGFDGEVDSAIVKTSLVASNDYVLLSGVSVTNGTTYTISVWVKMISGTVSNFIGKFYSPHVSFSSMTPVNKADINGETWVRIWAYGTSTYTGNTNITLAGYDSTPSTQIAYYGPQVEIGSFPTSYIPTSGSTVTRSADSASMTSTNFSDWYNGDGGTTYFEASPNGTTYGSIFSYQKDGSGENATELYYPHGSGNDQIRFSVRSNGAWTRILNVDDSLFTTDFNAKVALVLMRDDIAFTSLGKTPATGTGAIADYTELNFNSTRLDVKNWNGTIKKFAFYPARLSNATLQALTES